MLFRFITSLTMWLLTLTRATLPRPGLGTERDQSLRALRPLTGAINSGQRTGVQQPGGISSQPLNGVRRKKDLNTPAAGLPNGSRA
ncbi:MAG: hypothetical protein OXS33_06335 [bacterium]|nr:hypothetical protein [bacterium]